MPKSEPVTAMSILGVHVAAQRFSDALATLADWVRAQQRRTVSTCTVYTVMMAEQDENVRAALNSADMVTADGMPLVWLQRWMGSPAAERVYGPDVLLELCRLTSERGDAHYFFGGLPGVAEQLAAELRRRFPALTVVGAYGPPGDALNDGLIADTVERINRAGPNIVWVGLGSPKQDVWMHRYRPLLDAPLLIGVGAAFDFLAGVKPQAPPWMRRFGLEWVFRLASEPRRLWRRYLIYNPRFILHMARSVLKRREESVRP